MTKRRGGGRGGRGGGGVGSRPSYNTHPTATNRKWGANWDQSRKETTLALCQEEGKLRLQSKYEGGGGIHTHTHAFSGFSFPLSRAFWESEVGCSLPPPVGNVEKAAILTSLCVFPTCTIATVTSIAFAFRGQSINSLYAVVWCMSSLRGR